MKEQFKKLAEAYGWVEIDSKNPHMISFKKEEGNDGRINFYFTTSTVTYQSWTKPSVTKKNCTLEDFEDLLISQQPHE